MRPRPQFLRPQKILTAHLFFYNSLWGLLFYTNSSQPSFIPHS